MFFMQIRKYNNIIKCLYPSLQDGENSAETRASQEMLRAMYPG